MGIAQIYVRENLAVTQYMDQLGEPGKYDLVGGSKEMWH